MTDTDIAIVGGGLLGAALGYGLSGVGARVTIFDEGDNAVRTARGNFGLVWVQGKGCGYPDYARWTLRSAGLWPAFAQRLHAETGTDPGYLRPGGFSIALDDAELQHNLAQLGELRAALGHYDFETVAPAQLHRQLPGVGVQVAGAIYCRHDGHVNPLRLLRALHEGYLHHAGRYRPRSQVRRIEPLPGGGFRLRDAADAPLSDAASVVLAAGHGSAALGDALGLTVAVTPQQGQIIVTERSTPVLHYPTDCVRQTDEGGFLLGASARDTGYDDRTDMATLRGIARRCLRAFPFLQHLRVQRAWAALRIMTPDGFPLYQQSSRYPGAYAFSCHSGVTLAAAHALEASRWVLAGAIPPEYRCFDARRFAAARAGANDADV